MIGRTPVIANAQTAVNYQNPYRIPYGFRTPVIYQVAVTGNREIGQVAKVKGVYIKEAQGVSKLDEVYVKKDSSTVEKIHQSVPTAQFNN